MGLSGSLDHVSKQPDVFITNELERRAPRLTDYLTEKLALQDLVRRTADNPSEVLPRLVELGMQATGSDSAGISLYEPNPAPGVFRWHHLRGTLARFTGATTPRDFSPCGVTLDACEPTLTQHPERLYTWIADAGISCGEVLLVPLYSGSAEPIGTLWLVADDAGHFDSGHARVLTELATFAGIALHMARGEELLQEALERQELLTREMNHRVKNVFAITGSLIRHTARSSATPDEMAETLSGRLHALAGAHAAVRVVDGEIASSADIANLTETILRPYKDSGHFSYEGARIRLGDRAANALAMIFHELATNAVKYGALKTDGTVALHWTTDGDTFVVRWIETGGPTIESPPATTGFGTRLTAAGALQLGGEIVHDWQPSGLATTIRIPVDRLAD